MPETDIELLPLGDDDFKASTQGIVIEPRFSKRPSKEWVVCFSEAYAASKNRSAEEAPATLELERVPQGVIHYVLSEELAERGHTSVKILVAQANALAESKNLKAAQQTIEKQAAAAKGQESLKAVQERLRGR